MITEDEKKMPNSLNKMDKKQIIDLYDTKKKFDSHVAEVAEIFSVVSKLEFRVSVYIVYGITITDDVVEVEFFDFDGAEYDGGEVEFPIRYLWEDKSKWVSEIKEEQEQKRKIRAEEEERYKILQADLFKRKAEEKKEFREFKKWKQDKKQAIIS